MTSTRRDFLKQSAIAAAALSMPFGNLLKSPSESVNHSSKAIHGFLLGAAYYPEWWKEDRWKEDFSKMEQLGFNAVRMGEFAWSHFEPTPGAFRFGWMDKAIEIAGNYDVKVILCTPTASLPPWLVAEDPDVLTGDIDGRYDPGVRKGFNTNNHNVLAADKRIVSAMARHFGDHPNIVGWQLGNEPGYPFTMHDDITRKAFQQWLRDKYGSLDALNDAWWASFWS